MPIKFLDNPQASAGGIKFLDGNPAPKPSAVPAPPQNNNSGGITGFIQSLFPGVNATIGDIASNSNAASDTAGADEMAKNLSGINQQLKIRLDKTNDPALKSQLQSAIQANLDQISKAYGKVGSNPQYNKTALQGFGDALSATAELAPFAAPFRGVAEGVRAGTMLDGIATNGLFTGGTAASRIAANAGDNAVHAVGQDLAGGDQSPVGMLGAGIAGGVTGAIVPTAIEGLGALKNTALGEVFNNPSKDVEAGMRGKVAPGEAPPAYAGHMAAADAAGVQVPQATVRDAAFNALGKFRAVPVDIPGPELKVIQDYLGTIGQKVPANATADQLGSLIRSEMSKTPEVQAIAEKYGLFKNFEPSLADQLTTVLKSGKFTRVSPTEPTGEQFAAKLSEVLQNNGHLGIDFNSAGSAIRSPADQKLIQNAVSDIYKWNDFSPSGVDNLKQAIGDWQQKATPGTKAYALLTSMRNEVQNAIKATAGPEYSQAMRDYQGFKAGQKFSKWLPSKTTAVLEGAGGLGALFGFLNPGAVAATAVASSPRLQGEAVRAAGKVIRPVSKVVGPAVPTLNQDAVTGILKMLKIIP